MPERPLANLRSVRVRMTVAATLVVAVAGAFASIGMVQAVRHRLVTGIDSQINARVQQVAGQLASGVPPGAIVVSGSPAEPGFISVQDRAGKIVSSAGRVALTPGFVTSASLPPGKSGMTTVGQGDDQLALGFTSVAGPGGALTVVAGLPLDSVNRSINALEGTLAVGLPLFVVLVALLAWVLTGRALRPVESIRLEVEAISAGTLHRRVPEPQTGDEISRLARTMNLMLDRLERASARQRQFVSDASHELRSPVTAIRAQLEVALVDPARTDWEAVARRTLAEEARLEALVADLLVLASADEQRELPSATPVDLAAVIRDEARRPVPVPIAVEGTREPMVVSGRADQLGRVFRNLLDNAGRYAARSVRVSLRADGRDAVVVVDDDGPGIPPEDRERVFDRFTRLDPSRVRPHHGGAGLGLAVARAIVDRHHGSLTLADSPSGGARFVVTLPR